MLNTYIRDIYCNTYLHPENALRVPNLMEKLYQKWIIAIGVCVLDL